MLVVTHYCKVHFRLRVQHVCGAEEGSYSNATDDKITLAWVTQIYTSHVM